MNNYDFQKGKDREEKIDKFLDTLGWYFSERKLIDSTAVAVKNLTNKLDDVSKIATEAREEMEKLNKNIEKANESSTKLSQALNRLTLGGIIVAGVGVIIAILNFIFEYFI